MERMSDWRKRFGLAAAVSAAILAFAAQSAAAISFNAPQQLAHGDPNGHPYYAGGEPSLAFDPTGDGHVYVTAPQGVPAVAGNGQGVAYWASSDHGQSFPLSGLTGSLTGGGDSDVVVDGAHNVFVADLEATASAICISNDFAHSFPNCSQGLAQNQQGPEDDREWLTAGNQPNLLYLTYHDFAGGFPIIERSTDGGKSFAPCGTILQPGSDASNNYSPVSGTLVSKPVIDPGTGALYVEFSEPDKAASPESAPINHLYMAVAPHGCSGGTVFNNYDIYANPGASLGKIFQVTARDGGGELYVVAAGNTSAADASKSSVWLFRSTDGGKSWLAPEAINPPSVPGSALPALAAGPGRGEFLAGWFGTSVSGDPNNTKDQWRYYAAESYDGGQTIAETTVSPTILHYGDICTVGVACGTVPGQPSNRNLFDFSSAAIDPLTGCGALAIPGDPYNNNPNDATPSDNFNSSAYVSLQTSGCLSARLAGTPASGSGASCLDRVAPHSRFTGKSVTGGRRRLSLRGASNDRGCGAKGRGKVTKVAVAVARLNHGRCQFVRRNGRLGRRESCADAPRHTFRARGTGRWKLALNGHFPPGTYRLWVRAFDASGNVERWEVARLLVRAPERRGHEEGAPGRPDEPDLHFQV